MPTPFIAWIDMIACASRPSRRSSQDTCEPSPGTTPNARTSNIPPSDSFALRVVLISSTIASLASASRQRTGDSSTPSKSAGVSSARLGRGDRADPGHVAEHLTPNVREEGLGERPGGHARGRLARARALEHVAHVGEAVLLDAGEVGVAGARQVDLGHLRLHRPRVHPLLPVGVVAVVDPERHRAAERAPVADAGRDLGAVLLDLHPPAAAVAELAPREVAVEVLGPQLEARGQALDDRDQAGAVGLARGGEAQRHSAHTLLAKDADAGLGRVPYGLVGPSSERSSGPVTRSVRSGDENRYSLGSVLAPVAPSPLSEDSSLDSSSVTSTLRIWLMRSL